MRRVLIAVPIAECKRRVLEFLDQHPGRHKPNEFAAAIWPGVAFHSQGAVAASSRILKHLEREGLICHSISLDGSDWGWVKVD